MKVVVAVLLFLLDGSLAQIPRYLLPSGSGSLPVLTTPQLQSLMSSSLSYGSPKRSSSPLILSSSASNTISRYGLPSGGHGGHNPSVVAIPLYVRNGANGLQRVSSTSSASSVYDILGGALNNDRSRYQPAASTNKFSAYSSYTPKKVTPVETYSRYSEKPSSSYAGYSKYDSPKTSSSSYDPVRYELTKSEPGYGDASTVSLLSSGYGGSSSRGGSGYGSSGVAMAYAPPRAASQQSQIPRLRAIEYDDNQKAALADFASALENFELKPIKNEDVYDIPAISPPSGPSSSSNSYGGSSSNSYSGSSSYASPARLAVAKKQEAVRQAVAAAVDRGQDGGYGGQSGYGKSQSSYDSQGSSSYDDRSYDRQPSGGYGQAANAGDYASAASSGDSYRSQVIDKYQPAAAVVEPETRYRQVERAVDNYRDSYRAAAADQYRAVERPVERQVENYRQEEPAYDNQDSYATRQPSSSDYYGSASSRQVEPSDPNCPYEDKYGPAPSSSSSYGQTSKLAAAISAAKAESGYERGLTSDRVVSTLTGSASGQDYTGQSAPQSDELDPSKLDLKIVHLPVSVLKRLVGSGELALPSFQKKKK